MIPAAIAAPVAPAKPAPAPRQLGFFETYVRLLQDMRDPTLAVWALSILTFPLFHAGIFQPGLVFSMIAVPLAFKRWNGRLGAGQISVVRALLIFVAWVLTVDVGWALLMQRFTIGGPTSFLLAPIPYVINVFVFLTAIAMFRAYGDRFVSITVHVVTLTACSQVALSFLIGGHGRAAILFANPNQLGYYSLLSSTIIALGGRRIRMSTVQIAIGLTVCMYLALVSSSKAALGGSALLLGLTVIASMRTAIVTALVLAAVLAFGGATSALDRFTARVSTNDPGELYEGRGYDRIWDNQQYWLLGAGEGGIDRFADTSTIGDHELHSSAGTVFFSYGVVGSVLSLMFLYQVMKGARWRDKLMLLPSLSYGIAHQSLRFTLFWVLLALLVCLKDERPRSRAPTPVRKPLS